MEARSSSMAMSRIYELNSASLQDYIRNFRPIEGQVGAVFLIDGQVVGLDSFGKPETFAKVFKKLLESYALDAIDQYNPQKEIKVHKSQVTELIKSALSTEIESRPSVGLGMDLRIESRKLTGFALGFEEQIMHLAVFVKISNGVKKDQFTRITRFSARSRNH